MKLRFPCACTRVSRYIDFASGEVYFLRTGFLEFARLFPEAVFCLRLKVAQLLRRHSVDSLSTKFGFIVRNLTWLQVYGACHEAN